jgi:hypothetical protein
MKMNRTIIQMAISSFYNTHRGLVRLALGLMFVSTCLLSSAGRVEAAIITREESGLDENLSDNEGDIYAPVQNILLANIPLPSGIRFGDSEAMYQGLFYYSIVHLGFMDIPFNYIVTWEGIVYEGKSGGQDVQPLLADSVDDAFRSSVLIGYYGNNQEMTYAGKRALVELVSRARSYSGLASDAVSPVHVSLAPKPEGVALARLSVTSSDDAMWNGIVREVAGLSTADVELSDLTVVGSVEEVTYNQSVIAGENFVVTAQIRNSGTVPWYGSGLRPVYLSTSDPRDHESALFVTDNWASFARVVVPDEEWVMPDTVGTFSFEIKTPLIAGEYSETFELLWLPGTWIEGTQFTITFTVADGGYDLVRIIDTETGYLNVRDCPSSGCAEIGKVVPGDVLIQKGIEGNWYKVQLDDGSEGWIYGKYVRPV